MTLIADPPDIELVQRAQSGSLDAFEQLVRRYQQRLLRFLNARCASPADAEDALQEAFAAAWRYRASYQPRWAFSTWLYRIALRKAAAQAARPRTWTVALQVDRDPTGDELDSRQQRDRLWGLARQHLGDAQFTALWLYYVEDLTLLDIARVTGRPVTWIKVNLFRARRRLAAGMQRDEWLQEEPVMVVPTLGELE